MFEVSIEQSVLAKALEYLSPTVGKNANGLGDNCFYMQGTGTGSMSMYTTNTIESTQLEVIVSMGGDKTDKSPCIDFNRFKAIVNSIPSNEIIIMKEQVDELLINFANHSTMKLAGRTGGMATLPANQFPQNSSTRVPKSFVQDALKNVCTIIDNSATGIYSCMRMYTNANDIEITAVDITCKRTFVQRGKATNNNPTHEILVEPSKLKKSIKLFEDFNELDFYMNNNLVMIKAADPKATVNMKTNGMINNIIYYCRRFNGTFPSNIGANFNSTPNEYIELNKEEVLNCFSRVKALEDRTSGNTIQFKASEDEVSISMSSTAGIIHEKIKQVKTINFGWNTIFKYPNIGDILKIIPTDTFEIGVMPAYPANYILKATGQTDIMFTVPTMKPSKSVSND